MLKQPEAQKEIFSGADQVREDFSNHELRDESLDQSSGSASVAAAAAEPPPMKIVAAPEELLGQAGCPRSH